MKNLIIASTLVLGLLGIAHAANNLPQCTIQVSFSQSPNFNWNTYNTIAIAIDVRDKAGQNIHVGSTSKAIPVACGQTYAITATPGSLVSPAFLKGISDAPYIHVTNQLASGAHVTVMFPDGFKCQTDCSRYEK